MKSGRFNGCPGGPALNALVRYLENRRYAMVRSHARGWLLDVGCGGNRLVREYGDGIGVDVYPWEGVDQVVEDTARLPFADGSFDTVSFVACLNHIPNRQDVLREARRVLKPEGQLLTTMIGPTISRLWHFVIRPWDEDQTERGMKAGEVWGIDRQAMRRLLEDAGFELVEMKGFIFGLNTLYVGRPKATCVARTAAPSQLQDAETPRVESGGRLRPVG